MKVNIQYLLFRRAKIAFSAFDWEHFEMSFDGKNVANVGMLLRPHWYILDDTDYEYELIRFLSEESTKG